MDIILGIIALLALAGGGGGSYLFYQKAKKEERRRKKAEKVERKEISEEEAIEKASAKAKSIILDAKDEALKIKAKIDKYEKEKEKELDQQDQRLSQREKKIIERSNALDLRFDKLEARERSLEQSKRDVKVMRDKIAGKLEEIAKLSREEAQEQLKEEVEEDLKKHIARRIREAEFKIQSEADDKAQHILVDAMQKSATDYVPETTVTTLDIASEDLKGRIIGREGRNIKTFEKLTGVDIVVDEAPEAVTISCFDAVRREVAAIALKKLLADGRIHPGRIEEVIDKVKRDIGKEIRKTGEKLAYDAGFSDLPPEIIKLLGRFKYRYSYGQNLVKHTLEMVNLGEALASEVGADVELVKKACLLHDIGKVMTHEIEGAHHHISGDILKKHKFDEMLINAVVAHHGDVEFKSIEAILVYIADAISGARPGARRDNYEEYIKRVKALEEVATSFDKVKEAYAIHAGREIRVIVKPEEANDEDVTILSHKIAEKIHETQTYPGTVQVTVIKETRAMDTAK